MSLPLVAELPTGPMSPAELREVMRGLRMRPSGLASMLVVSHRAVLYWLQGRSRVPLATVALLRIARHRPYMVPVIRRAIAEAQPHREAA